MCDEPVASPMVHQHKTPIEYKKTLENKKNFMKIKYKIILYFCKQIIIFVDAINSFSKQICICFIQHESNKWINDEVYNICYNLKYFDEKCIK